VPTRELFGNRSLLSLGFSGFAKHDFSMQQSNQFFFTKQVTKQTLHKIIKL
jgi:hypothetical protein